MRVNDKYVYIVSHRFTRVLTLIKLFILTAVVLFQSKKKSVNYHTDDKSKNARIEEKKTIQKFK